MSRRNVGADDRAAALDRRTVAKSVVLAATLLVAGSGAAHAQPANAAKAQPADDFVVRLPAPTGPHQVGVTMLHLVDRHRRDPWDGAIPVRELMVTVFYPARTVRGYPIAPQMTPRRRRGSRPSTPSIGTGSCRRAAWTGPPR